MTYRVPTPTTLIPPLLTHEARVSPEVFGTLIAEIVTPGGAPRVPELPGWELRAWPVARLGDATLEASPRFPHLSADHLRADLASAGVQVLGPIRRKLHTSHC